MFSEKLKPFSENWGTVPFEGTVFGILLHYDLKRNISIQNCLDKSKDKDKVKTTKIGGTKCTFHNKRSFVTNKSN